MTVTSDVCTGWLHIGQPVLTGAQPAGAITLAWLAHRENHEQLHRFSIPQADKQMRTSLN